MELEASWAARGSVAGMTSVMILMPPDSVTVVAAITCGQSRAEEPGQVGKLKDQASSHPTGDQHVERVHMSGDTRSTDILLQGCPTPHPAPHTSLPHPRTSFSLGLPSSSSPQPPLAVSLLFEALREVMVRLPFAPCRKFVHGNLVRPLLLNEVALPMEGREAGKNPAHSRLCTRGGGRGRQGEGLCKPEVGTPSEGFAAAWGKG